MNEQPDQAEVKLAMSHRGEPSGGVHHIGHAPWITLRDYDRANERVAILAAHVAWQNDKIKQLRQAIDASGQAVLLCLTCGKPLVTLPDPLVMCEACCDKADEAQPTTKETT